MLWYMWCITISIRDSGYDRDRAGTWQVLSDRRLEMVG